MKKHTLLLTIGFLFLSANLQAMDKNNILSYEKDINSIIRNANPPLVDPKAGAFPYWIGQYHNVAMTLAQKFNLNNKIAHQIYVNAILDLIMEVRYTEAYFAKEHIARTPAQRSFFRNNQIHLIEWYIANNNE